MGREKFEEMEKVFFAVLEKLQERGIGEIIKKHKDLLPRHIIVGEVARVRDLIISAFDGVEYFIVMSRKGKIVGLIKDTDLIYLLLAGETHYTTFPPMDKLSIRRERIPIDVATQFVAEEVMRKNPILLEEADLVVDLLHHMRMSRSHAIIVVDEKGKPIAVMDEHTFLKLMKEEMKAELSKFK
ncbi:MAG: hypothetical protein DRO10_00715 [Thermoprotei archaeon]|nr:MAG: hypothetical protein DRO10_00715 [Thermoprotei archaeon]